MTEPRSDDFSRTFLAVALLGPIVVPVLVFLLVGLTSGMGMAGSVEALVEQSTGRRQNPLTTGALGLFPVLLLLLGLVVARRILARKVAPGWCPAAGWWGLTVILLLLGWANYTFWPLFLPERVYPGFPHGLELVITPIFFAPVGATLAAVAGGIVASRGPQQASADPPSKPDSQPAQAPPRPPPHPPSQS